MKKNEIKKLKTINFNHEKIVWVSDIPFGKSVFIIKKGRKNRYFLEIERSVAEVFISRYNFRNADFSKYDKESDLAFEVFSTEKLIVINHEFVERFAEICEAKKLLQDFNLLNEEVYNGY